LLGCYDLKVLVVDDNYDIVVVSFYCETKQIDCDTITGGKSGLSAIRNNHYDLILLDVAMPEFTGLDVIRSLKADGLLEKMNVVVFTASSDPKMYEEIRNSGVKEILRKPVE
jgi:CheY-like chemotaxis protein